MYDVIAAYIRNCSEFTWGGGEMIFGLKKMGAPRELAKSAHPLGLAKCGCSPSKDWQNLGAPSDEWLNMGTPHQKNLLHPQ